MADNMTPVNTGFFKNLGTAIRQQYNEPIAQYMPGASALPAVANAFSNASANLRSGLYNENIAPSQYQSVSLKDMFGSSATPTPAKPVANVVPEKKPDVVAQSNIPSFEEYMAGLKKMPRGAFYNMQAHMSPEKTQMSASNLAGHQLMAITAENIKNAKTPQEKLTAQGIYMNTLKDIINRNNLASMLAEAQ